MVTVSTTVIMLSESVADNDSVITAAQTCLWVVTGTGGGALVIADEAINSFFSHDTSSSFPNINFRRKVGGPGIRSDMESVSFIT